MARGWRQQASVIRAGKLHPLYPGAIRTGLMQVGWCDSTRFLIHYQPQQGFAGSLPLLPLLSKPLAKPHGPLLHPQGWTPVPGKHNRNRTTQHLHFNKLNSKAVCDTSANITVLPWTRNSSQTVQVGFFQLSTPVPIKYDAWPGLNNKHGHNTQFLRRLTKYYMCHHHRLRPWELPWYTEFGRSTYPSTIPLFCKKYVRIHV